MKKKKISRYQNPVVNKSFFDQKKEIPEELHPEDEWLAHCQKLGLNPDTGEPLSGVTNVSNDGKVTEKESKKNKGKTGR